MMSQLERVLQTLTERMQQVGVKDESGQDGFAREYSKLKRKSVKHRSECSLPTTAGELPQNSRKNRYKDILPFDYSRVILSLQTDEATSDYINANFVQGLNGARTYIATQGPLAHTVIDLWRMIWEYDVKVIVMACQEVEATKKKCEMYWAEENKAKAYGSFLVECESMEGSKQSRVAGVTQDTEDTCKGYFIRTLKVTFREETRIIFHFQFPSWPDHGIPESPSSILAMVTHIHDAQAGATSPICVHCSAGCGRTGALCVIHYTWELIKSKRLEEHFSIFHVIQEIRTQRPAAVQTKDQYEFVYRAICAMFRNELEKNPEYESLGGHCKNLGAHYENLLNPPGAESYCADSAKSGKPMAKSSIPVKTSRLSVPSPSDSDRAESPTKSPVRKRIFPPADDGTSSSSNRGSSSPSSFGGGGSRKQWEPLGEGAGRDTTLQPRWRSNYEVVAVPEKPLRTRTQEASATAPSVPDYENVIVPNGSNGGAAGNGGKAFVSGGGAGGGAMQHYEVVAPGPAPADPGGVDGLYAVVVPPSRRPGALTKAFSLDGGGEARGDDGRSSAPVEPAALAFSQGQPPRPPAPVYRESSSYAAPLAARAGDCRTNSLDKTEHVITAGDGADDAITKGNQKAISLPFNIKQGVKMFGKQLFGKSEPSSAAVADRPGVMKTVSNSDYEDIETCYNHSLTTATVSTSSMGFGHRLAKPRGPRNPPPDWPKFLNDRFSNSDGP